MSSRRPGRGLAERGRLAHDHQRLRDGPGLAQRRPDERALLHLLAGPVFTPATAGAKERLWLRVLITVALLAGGLAVLLHGHHQADLLWPLGGILLILAGTAVAFSPWCLRIARDLVAERQARIRAVERADMAARVHASVLQTLPGGRLACYR